MKKTIISIILGVSLAVAPSAFALTKMSDSNMKSATGQTGVSIAIDNVKIESYTGSTKNTDLDTNASVVIGAKHTIKEYLAMTSDTDYVTDFNTATGTTLADAANFGLASALTIDVGTCAALSAGLDFNSSGVYTTVAGVVIGLPTLLISTTADSYTVGIEMTGAANTGGTYIQISKGDSAMAILGGTVEIAPH